MEPKIIALDQNHWINLVRVDIGKNKDKKINEILLKLKELLYQDSVILPFSIERHWETIHRRNRLQRHKFEYFVSQLTNGFLFKPRNYQLLQMECYNFVCDMIEEPERKINIREYIIEKNYDLIFSKPWEEKWVSDIYKDFTKTIKEMERNREHQIKDKKQRSFFDLNQYIIQFIKPTLVDVTIAMGIPEKKIKYIDDTLEDYKKFLIQIPSLYVTFELVFIRDSQYHRRIQIQDISDISFLSVAIPYSDIVLTDKYMKSLIENSKLNEIYNTIVLSNLKDLSDHI